MSSENDSSSECLAGEPLDATSQDTTPLGQNDASPSLLGSDSEPQEGSSYMLEAWAQAPASSEPWSSAKAAYSPQS
ncbi:hypothetical protein N7517_004645 [Penicillium concentricum]|uniref:Uncharacterized protein n=1 Tax=Penicillium concentricum TaxID=293559 RepID=A0A9W9V9K4_9EURO|nr:uncharacterized protein N7517_004645 [Penicillium concentricum]KAJ5372639.1 hypothetical protein N7517_004645 [Penicillium concentricum]